MLCFDVNLTNQASEFDPRPTVPQLLLEGPLAALLEWARSSRRSSNLAASRICRRIQNHLRIHRGPSEGGQEAGHGQAICRDDRANAYRGGLLNPCSSEAVRLGLKKMGRETSARQDQTHPLGRKEIKEFIDSASESLRADCERAMLCVAYETLARRGELVALEMKDIDFHPHGTGHALIRRGKTDAEGQGRVAYLSRETVNWLKLWLEHSGVTVRAVSRHVIGKTQIGGPLHPGSITPIFKRVVQCYAEKVNTARSGMARGAENPPEGFHRAVKSWIKLQRINKKPSAYAPSPGLSFSPSLLLKKLALGPNALSNVPE